MKKILNNPEHVVTEAMQGLALANPQLEYLPEFEVIVRRDKPQQVGIISGGGAGHEPAHAGYVGPGMLTAAVSGHVFSAPSPDRVLEAIRQANTGMGVLLIIKNYSGDIMNFELAAELAHMEDIAVDHVVVRDDVAVEESTHSTGRRGIAGTVLVHKIAGAMAATGASLAEVKAMALRASENLRSMGMAMSPCIIPSVGKAGFSLGDDEIELGMGIHGEPGVERSPMLSAKQVVDYLMGRIFADHDFAGADVLLLSNGLGATPMMELLIVNKDAQEYVKAQKTRVYGNLVGNYMTSMEMSGCSLSVLKLDEELKRLWDAPCQTPQLTLLDRREEAAHAAL